MRKPREQVSTEIEPDKKYTPGQLDAIATELLRQDSNTELCRECGKRGEKTGSSKAVVQAAVDEAGNKLIVDFAEFGCVNDHTWYQGEGKRKGTKGENPILFEEHIQSRRRREILPKEGTPDPHIVQGLYNRCHPQGRKVNTPEQRARHGASWYR